MEIPESSNFVQDIIVNDLKTGKRTNVHTRFPPEPNGYIHIGHAKSICLNFGTANKYKDFGGITNLRFDDTNPTKEDVEYVDSIREDVKWLGFEWKGGEYFASDYYDQIYAFAEKLIEMGKAYVEDLTRDEMQEYRGNDAGKPSRPSPYRDRSVEENMKLFREMRDGKYADGEKCLRAKVDLSSPNMNMRDPVIYRIKHCTHHRTGDKWCIYPMYDFAHPLSDWIEGITHSICTLEFEAHRPLYDWFLIELGLDNRPQQIEFARLNLTYTMMSKRKLLELVETKAVMGWNDPRMPTVCGYRRRGFTPSSIREFCDRIGVSKADSMVDVNLLYFCIREELNKTANRVMAVIDPVKLVIDNWEDGKVEMIKVENNPNDETAGTREVPFGKELYIEADDFMEEPPKKYFRLKPDGEVRLKGAYFVTCKSVEKDANGKVTVIHCEYDPQSKGGETPDGRKVKGTIHWVHADSAVKVTARLYENIIDEEKGVYDENGDLNLNPHSLTICNAYAEPELKEAKPFERFQFVRNGYFCVDYKDSAEGAPVFNRIVGLKSSFKLPGKK